MQTNMKSSTQLLGARQSKARMWRKVAVAFIVLAGLGAALGKMWHDAQCTTWLTSAEGAKVCVATNGSK